MKRRITLAINLLLGVAICIATYRYFHYSRYRIPGLSNLGMKGVTGGIFVLCCLLNVLFYPRGARAAYRWVLLLGQILACSGDIGLGFDFVTGALLFAAGHVGYYAAFCLLDRPRWRDLPLMAAVFLVSYLVVTSDGFRLGGRKMIVMFYAVVISCMLGKALSLMFARQVPSALRVNAAVGAVMFYVSDLMLAINMFGGGGRVYGAWCLALYFPGEWVLALSAWMSAGKKKTEGTKRTVLS